MRDKQVESIIESEYNRQVNEVCLIASENYTSRSVMEAQGSILTNKYAEGYPGARYYGGCEFVDQIETLAIDRLCKLFGAKYANVQPHSGSQANQAVYAAVLNKGDTVLAMDLNSGAHITHVSKASYTSRIYVPQYYGLNERGEINLEELESKLYETHPSLLIVGGSSYPREIKYNIIRDILDKYNSKCTPKCLMMVDMAHVAGLVAAKLHQNPVQYADIVTSTTHKTLRGPRGGFILTNNDELAKKINTAVFPRTQGGPLEHVIAGKAVCFGEASTEDFVQYQKQVLANRLAMENVFKKTGIDLVSGGSDTHMLLLDLRNTHRSGKEVEAMLESVGIITNKNTVPGDTRPKTETSGLRIGTPAITTRGFNEEDCIILADIIANFILFGNDNHYKIQAEEVVKQLCKEHPTLGGV